MADIFGAGAYVGAMKPTSRKPAGVLLIVLGLIVYAGVAARLVAVAGPLPWYVAVPVYLVLGCLWLLPLKPLLQWMETGSWRAPR